jgi:hypothetical protein
MRNTNPHLLRTHMLLTHGDLVREQTGEAVFVAFLDCCRGCLAAGRLGWLCVFGVTLLTFNLPPSQTA